MKGVCKVCGCTMKNPCFSHRYGFCWWNDKEEDLCSHCATAAIRQDPTTIHCVHGLEFPVLTVHQPYALMLVKGLKKIEYRNWKLPKQYVGQRIFIHAGRDLHCTWDKHFSDEMPFYQCVSEAMADELSEMILGSVVFGESQGPFDGIKYGTPYKMYEWPVTDPIRLENNLKFIHGKQSIWKIKF